MKLEVGKFYRCRNGNKVQVMEIIPHTAKNHRCVVVYNYNSRTAGRRFANGSYYNDSINDLDIVSEWKEPRSLKRWGHVMETKEGEAYLGGAVRKEKSELDEIGSDFFGHKVIDHYCVDWKEGALPVFKSLKGNYFFGEICCDTSADTTRMIEDEQGDGNKVVDWVEVS